MVSFGVGPYYRGQVELVVTKSVFSQAARRQATTGAVDPRGWGELLATKASLDQAKPRTSG
jgi:hypothetical protein